MKDLTRYSDDELSLQVFNDEYFYNERNWKGKNDYVLALVNEEFYYTPKQMEILIQDLNYDRDEQLLYELNNG